MSQPTAQLDALKISDTMGDYLGEIYRMGHQGNWISTTSVAERLGVSGPATVRMMHRLQKLGLVEHLPYNGVRLTELGQLAALMNIRRHRLVERFLVDVLGFGWHEAHDEADTFQRGINQRLEDRIDEIMNYPQQCPHGEPIPTRDGIMPQIDDRPLTVIPENTRGRISRIRERQAEKLVYLAEIGLVPGAEFTLLHRAPFDGPLRVQLGSYEQVIGHELASAIWVTVD